MGQELLQHVATWNAEGRNDMSKFGEILWRFDGFSNKTFKIVTIQVRGMHLFIWFIACIETVGPCRCGVLAPIAHVGLGCLHLLPNVGLGCLHLLPNVGLVCLHLLPNVGLGCLHILPM